MMAKKFFSKALSVGLSLALCASLVAPALAASFTDLNNAINCVVAAGGAEEHANGTKFTTDDGERYGYGWNSERNAYDIHAWNSTGEDGAEVRNIQLNNTVANSGNESSITIGSGKNINLDLNGYNVDNRGTSSDRSTIWINGGTLTLDDHSNDTDSNAEVGKVTGGVNSGILVENNGKLTMNDGEISDNESKCKGSYHGGGVHVKGEQSEFTMNGGTITNNTADYQGGGVHVHEGTFNMNGGEISGNTAQWGGGVNVYNGTINMSGGTIGGNKATNDGSDVWVKADKNGSASFEMTNSTVNGSGAQNGQHTVVVQGNGSTFTMGDNANVTSADDAASDVLAKPGSTIIYNRNDSGGLHVTTVDGEELKKEVTVDKDTGLELNIVYPTPAPEEPETPVIDPVEVTIDEPAVPLASGPVTRAEFIDYLWRHENMPESAGVCTFADVEDTHEYFDALCWAEENGVAEAYFNAEGHEDGTFEPDELVTVAMVRDILIQFALYVDMVMPELTTLANDGDEAVLNCDEVLTEFFGEE